MPDPSEDEAPSLEPPYREIGWAVAEMVCGECGHPWVAVYMIGTEDGECSQCGQFTPLPQELIRPPDDRAN